MTEAQKIERANSYRQMMETWAWKDFINFLAEERSLALEIGINSDDQKEVQLNRGRVRQLDSIKNELGFILSGR